MARAKYYIKKADSKESGYMVYINNPNGHDGEQWVFGYYKTFGRALKKAVAIVEKREYPKPIEIW